MGRGHQDSTSRQTAISGCFTAASTTSPPADPRASTGDADKQIYSHQSGHPSQPLGVRTFSRIHRSPYNNEKSDSSRHNDNKTHPRYPRQDALGRGDSQTNLRWTPTGQEVTDDGKEGA